MGPDKYCAAQSPSPCSFLKKDAGCAFMNMTLGYALRRDRRVIRTKLICPMKGNGKDALTRSCSNSIATMVAALAMAAGDLALDGAVSDAKLFANRSALFANDAESAMIACGLLWDRRGCTPRTTAY